ncbi:MAG: BNR repeat-containing protein [Saprospiraceae bacterium]|nr:BNR repeat-containing protein [Saprospiraceae bacterium]
MRKSFCFAITFIVSLSYGIEITAQEQIGYDRKVISTTKIADVWAGHPVGFNILTAADDQYISYYDSARNMCVAKRRLSNDEWTHTILPSRVGWDSHNYIALALDKKGFIHVSGNMHGVPLVYFRSAQPRDISTFEAHQMVGREEQRVTYPVFFENNGGDLFFQYRDGGSGNGITYINQYDPEIKQWKRVLDEGLFDGEGETNAYPNNPVAGPDGFFHYMWVWRLNPIANTNHNLSYVRTRDFLHFENIEGEQVDIPIRYRDRSVIADPVGPWNGLMNSCKILSFDSRGRVIMVYHKFDKKGRSQLFICRHENGEWINRQISDWPDFTWAINATGSLGNAIKLNDIRTDSAGHIYVGYAHEKYGDGLLEIDEDRLILLNDLKGESLLHVEGLPSTIKEGMQINSRWDGTGQYILQWETLQTNFDKARDAPYPPPSPLMLYEIDPR